jgi:hypothetical protein
MRVHAGHLAVAIALASGAANAATLEIKDAVARVTVIPEARSDIKVEVTRANASTPLTIRTLGDRTILDGNLGRRIGACRGAGDSVVVKLRGGRDIAWSELTQVVIRTPRDVRLQAGGAVFGVVGRSVTLSLDNAGCGDWTIANVEGAARINQAGSGDSRLGTTGSLRVRAAGSGDVAAAAVKGGLDIDIAGSGSTLVSSINGPLEIDVAGSGDVMIGGGRAATMNVSIAGSGDVDFRGVADNVRARIAGSGNVHVNEVKGEISRSIMGSGKVRVGQQ